VSDRLQLRVNKRRSSSWLQWLTLQATRWGQSFPKPSGGEILRSRATTSRCLIRPLQQRHQTAVHEYSSQLTEHNAILTPVSVLRQDLKCRAWNYGTDSTRGKCRTT